VELILDTDCCGTDAKATPAVLGLKISELVKSWIGLRLCWVEGLFRPVCGEAGYTVLLGVGRPVFLLLSIRGEVT